MDPACEDGHLGTGAGHCVSVWQGLVCRGHWDYITHLTHLGFLNIVELTPEAAGFSLTSGGEHIYYRKSRLSAKAE